MGLSVEARVDRGNDFAPLPGNGRRGGGELFSGELFGGVEDDYAIVACGVHRFHELLHVVNCEGVDNLNSIV